MRNWNAAKPMQSTVVRLCLSACAAAVFAISAQTAGAQAVQPATKTTHTAAHTSKAHHKAAKHVEEAKPEAPPQPEMPKWPVNDSAVPAKVTWDSRGLEIRATNSSLIQILHDYSVATGSKIEGLNKDERIFGTYGPGNAHDVLTQLLNGTGYNVLMFGDLGQDTPREVVLSTRTPDNGSRAMARPTPEPAYDDAEDNSDDQPEPPQPIMQPQVMQPNMPPGNQPVRTPQQIMEEMQRRQQQLQQQQPDPQ